MNEQDVLRTPAISPQSTKIKKRPLLVVLVLLVITVGVVLTGVLVGKKQTSKTPSEILFNQPTPITSVAPDIRTYWKVYKSNNLDFEIYYPNGWTVLDSQIVNDPQPLSVEGTKLVKDGVISMNFGFVRKKVTDLEDWISLILEQYKVESDSPNFSYKSKSATKIAGYEAIKTEATGYGQLNYTDYFILEKMNGRAVHISFSYPNDEYSQQEGIINQILSTFRFLEESQLIFGQ